MDEGFHWRDGWFFKRDAAGNVIVTHEDLQLIIPAAEWCSIITAVSRDGDVARNYEKAKDFHGKD